MPEPSSTVAVEALTEVSDDVVAELRRLLPLVSSRGGAVSAERVGAVVAHPGTTVLVARVDGRIVGSATLIRLVSLVGQFGYVEEVVVDDAARGRGVGRALMRELLELARRDGLDFVELTSRPARAAANGLYRSLGFALRETNVYRFDLRG